MEPNNTRTVPAFIAAILLAAPAFHLLFGSKWDAAIPLFQILMARGIFVVLNGLYSNFLLAIGRPRLLVVTELIRDSVALIALIITLPLLARPDGLALLIWGQFAATLLTWAATLPMTKKAITRKTAKSS